MKKTKINFDAKKFKEAWGSGDYPYWNHSLYAALKKALTIEDSKTLGSQIISVLDDDRRAKVVMLEGDPSGLCLEVTIYSKSQKLCAKNTWGLVPHSHNVWTNAYRVVDGHSWEDRRKPSDRRKDKRKLDKNLGLFVETIQVACAEIAEYIDLHR